MKTRSKILLTSSALILGMASLVQAQTYIPNFNFTNYATDFRTSTNNSGGSFAYTATSGDQVYTNTLQWGTLTTGQDGWINTTQEGGAGYGPGIIYHNGANPYRANPNLNVLGGDSYFSTDINNSVTYPQSATTYIAQTQAGTGTNFIHFDTTFYTYANTPNNNSQWDTLGWTLLNTAGNALLSINLNTTDGTAWSLSASSYGNVGITNQALKKANGTDIAAIPDNNIVHLGFNIYGVGTTNETITVLNYTNLTSTNLFTTGVGNYTVIGTNNLIGDNFTGIAGGTNIASLASTWTLADTANQLYTNSGVVTTGYPDYADNSLLMSTLVVAVPEPKTWILFGLSGLVLVVALRRSRSS